MKNRLISALFIVICLSVFYPQTVHPQDLSEPIPFHPDVLTGRFDNGLTYYIMENHKPENRAQFWLVVNAGSILEDEDQQGLAHFTEHMAFNGTEHFARHEIIDYLESIGMQFGPEINAYTGFDETVYMLQVPTDSMELVYTAFEILEDWARFISFEDEEIDKERGVIIEEWRTGRGADGRMRDKQLPVIFQGSKYADRLPIGKKEILETFDHESIRRFYSDWYRPDLMALIAVGDFDKNEMRDLVAKHFEQIPAKENARDREVVKVPGHKETLFAIATDPEATNTSISVYYKMDPVEHVTIDDYRNLLIERLNIRMINNRLYELLNQPEPPFLFGMTIQSRMVRSMEIYMLGAAVKEDAIIPGLEALLIEAERVKRFGFTQTELDRTKTQLLRDLEQSYNERDKSQSSIFARECRDNFLEGEPMPGIAFEFDVAGKLLPGITLDEVNDLIGKWMKDEDRVVLVGAPEKDGVSIPGENELLALLDQMDELEVEPYEDLVSDQPLVSDMPEPATISNEKRFDPIDVTEWTLSNGIKVVLKSTDFKNDEIQFYAFSPGGSSLLDTEDSRAVKGTQDIIYLSGISEFDLNDLNKKISEEIVTVFPYIDELTEGLVGNCAPADMETMFQLIYLYITAPRKDITAYQSYLTRMKGFIQNRSADPESAFYDTIMVTMSQYHPRKQPWSDEVLDAIDYEKVWSFYIDRFSDASDFTFVFVGNFDLESIKPFITAYLGGLPAVNREETWKDIGVKLPEGVIEKAVYKGIEEKGKIRITFSGPVEWTPENNYLIKSMASVLDIKLREVIREDLSGTYGVSVSSSVSLYPREEFRLNISFDCNPGRIDELTNSVFLVLDSLKTDGPDEIYITKVTETQLRSYEIQLKENGYWLSQLQNYYFTGQDPESILKYPEKVKTMTSGNIQKTATKYLNMNNYVKVVLLPEKKE
ncbi:MAG: insulinase family protein [Bacteroidales bacterium]|nr:insulinase family protein [Bacteroidales bacterium]